VIFALAAAAPVRARSTPSHGLLASARDRLWGLLNDGDELVISPEGVLVAHLVHSVRVSNRQRIWSITTSLARRPLQDTVGEVHVDVGVSWGRRGGRKPVELAALIEHAIESLTERDLQARRWAPPRTRRRSGRPKTLLQFGIVLLATFVLPLIAMVAGHFTGVAIAGTLYALVVGIILISTALQWVETIIGLSSRPNPPPSSRPSPSASAIIAAYLPNEADTILQTLRVFLHHEYSGGLQVILAYNSPRPLPVEAALAALAEADPRLVIVRVPDSHSKAQNVNAALGVVTGEFVGIFDADHHPEVGSFERASRWLAGDADVVQGHCVVRNGSDSFVARTAAVEFEQIYAVSHRGRQLLHGFGVFGGSNGYWKTDTIRTVRMVSAMLTEDIDSSIRATRAGARIVNDPGLISRELAPVTIAALWRQRMRWAQGWAQVTAVHARVLLVGDDLSFHQRIGMFFHLVWREAFPIVSALMWPVLAFYLWRDSGIGLSQPAWGLVTLFTLGSAPLQILLVRLVAHPRIARHGSWWVWYLVVTTVAYQEFRNTIARIALVKLAMGERHWVVTPRTNLARVTHLRPVFTTAA
jgi:cellulose synthase/poly-beta-1,6-N-acetylglucosamine synthase-like glycosyltransferase